MGFAVAVARTTGSGTGDCRLMGGLGVLVAFGRGMAVGALATLTFVGIVVARRAVGASTVGCGVGDGRSATATLLGVGTEVVMVFPDLDGGMRNAR